MLQTIPIDTVTVSQSSLDIDNKIRSNRFSWKGQFSPQLVHSLLRAYAGDGCSILDPFMGSGTVLVEAGCLGHCVSGAEINPAAFHMALVYRLINSPLDIRRETMAPMNQSILSAFSAPLGPPDVETVLVALWRDEPDTIRRSLYGTLIVLVDLYENYLTSSKVVAKWRALQEIVLALPYSVQLVTPIHCDARRLPLESNTVDLVLTSPPYINVFNYHQQYRASIEAMGWDALRVARAEVGSNRKHRQNRFLTVVQYCLDMNMVFQELYRVCKPFARIIFVVGRESNVLQTKFYNSDIVARIAMQSVGFVAECRQERSFRNRFGALIYEDILHFRPPQSPTQCKSPTDIAREVLEEAYMGCPVEASSRLRDALVLMAGVSPSNLYISTDDSGIK